MKSQDAGMTRSPVEKYVDAPTNMYTSQMHEFIPGAH